MEETKQQPLALRVCAELAGQLPAVLCHLRLLHMGFGRVWHQYRVLRVGYRLGICRSHRHLLPRVRWPAESGHHRSLRAGFQDENPGWHPLCDRSGHRCHRPPASPVVKLLPTSEQVAAKVWLTPAVNGFENGSVSYSLLTQYGITFSITLAIVVEVVASLIVVATAMSSLGDHGESSDRHVIAMGLAYGLATAISYPVTGAGLNPARSTGIALAAMNEGLTQNPLQQLWVFWISPVLAAAVVALVMIIAQMMTTPKVPAAADLPQTDADANADTLDDGEFFDQAASSDGDSAEKDVAEESKEAEVGNQQADSQGDADEGVERH